MQTHKVLIFVLSVFFFACNTADDTLKTTSDKGEETTKEPTDSATKDSPNILLIIADDMGLDATPNFEIGDIKPVMPTLDKLMNEGLTFNNLWSNPTCTPTRAAMITGKFGFRTHMTQAGDELSTAETSLQTYIDQNSGKNYTNAVIGKWHLANDMNHPVEMGVDYFAGFLGGSARSYSEWEFVENGAQTSSTDYTTTKFTDLAMDWIADQSQPWFLWLSYNAPHTPFHLPPDNLHHQGALAADEASIAANPIPYYMASLEAMDTEMGRLLDAMTIEERENTIIIFIGDNGTPNQVAQAYGNRRNKDTVYQGGVNVPMVVCGKDVARSGQTEDALINVTDIFATVADIASSGIQEINDSKSFKALLDTSNDATREFAFTEIGRDGNTADVAIRNKSHKYLLFADGTEALYDLLSDPLENQNLLDTDPLNDTDAVERDKLTAELARIRQ
ncbi:sulfatase-like hydrolase/transferase [Zobellia galactanivorans]|uniref:sulfatase-like hydrolase/transferase n=1 Tax=Zobellia galactanivorans (strain DSM 12802 / CCUG 47099 / CIP 106680 / NCIMB 13871 / Dsij) TaxID=63186 RepID=UPI0026E3FE19|nr:sulfatase-like hydrolase/transferase [Zobellia galactanivorans]MDO6811036.1 sulfatase-like hydrolase/transferase [Zobellia galactanivorans]